MSTPYPARSRLSRSSMTSTPNREFSGNISGLPHSPSTPYDIYNQRNHQSSPQLYSSPKASSAFLPSTSSQSTQAYRRNAVFGSPSVGRSPRVSQIGVSTSSQIASPHTMGGSFNKPVNRTPKYIRKKSFKQRAEELPSRIYDWILFSPLFDFADPAIGYPAGLLLHLLSLLALAVHPEGPLHLSFRGYSSQLRAKKLFTEQGSGGLAWRRRQSQDDAWRWLATMVTFTLLITALANAYHLFTARRRYSLWMKPTTEKVSSENASFVDLPHALDEEPHLSIHDRLFKVASHIGRASIQAVLWILEQGLHRLRQISYLGVIVRFLFPPTISRRLRSSPSDSDSNQMHAIDMWTAPDVQLRIFSLYSPLHAIFYILHLKSTRGFSHFLTLFILMALASAQVTLLVHFYTSLIKDKNLIAGEVMHEYNEKFVNPRAMPMSRDAWTMTEEAEVSAAKRQSWINRRHSSEEEEEERSSHHHKKSTPIRKGRATVGNQRLIK